MQQLGFDSLSNRKLHNVEMKKSDIKNTLN